MAFSISAWIFCCSCCFLPSQLKAVPSFDVSLDSDPEHRWDHVIEFYKEELKGTVPAALASLSEYDKNVADEFAAHSGFDEDQIAELRGMAHAIKFFTGITVTVEQLTLVQMQYELTPDSHCSGFLMALENGTVVHGRNLDNQFPFTMPDGTNKNLPDITFNVLWWRNQKPLMTSVNFLGYIGIHTGMRFDGWSFQQNTRPGNIWPDNLKGARNGGKSLAAVVRRTMETVPDYEGAVQCLWKSNFMAPQYFLLAGNKPYEGAVLAIDRGGTHKPDSPPIRKLSQEHRLWHLYQSNDDAGGDPGDSRRPAAAAMVTGWKQKDAAAIDVLKFMHAVPVFNPKTVFTWVAIPAKNFYATILPSEGPSPLVGLNKFFGGHTNELAKILDMYPGLSTSPTSLLSRKRRLRGSLWRQLHVV